MRSWVIAVVCLIGIGRLTAQEAAPTSDQAWKLLKEGNTRFVADKHQQSEPLSKQRAATAAKQRPIAIILTCADSRTTPEYIFDRGIGQLFVLRVAGNVTDANLIGSAEYGAAVLQAPLIIVLGHTNCGAVEAAVQGKELPSDNLKQLIGRVRTGGEKNPDVASRVNVQQQMLELTMHSKILKDFQGSGRIKIVGGVYDLKSGEVKWVE